MTDISVSRLEGGGRYEKARKVHAFIRETKAKDRRYLDTFQSQLGRRGIIVVAEDEKKICGCAFANIIDHVSGRVLYLSQEDMLTTVERRGEIEQALSMFLSSYARERTIGFRFVLPYGNGIRIGHEDGTANTRLRLSSAG